MADVTVLHPKEFVEVLGVQRLGARGRNLRTGDVRCNAAFKDFAVIEGNICHEVKLAQEFRWRCKYFQTLRDETYLKG